MAGLWSVHVSSNWRVDGPGFGLALQGKTSSWGGTVPGISLIPR